MEERRGFRRGGTGGIVVVVGIGVGVGSGGKDISTVRDGAFSVGASGVELQETASS